MSTAHSPSLLVVCFGCTFPPLSSPSLVLITSSLSSVPDTLFSVLLQHVSVVFVRLIHTVVERSDLGLRHSLHSSASPQYAHVRVCVCVFLTCCVRDLLSWGSVWAECLHWVVVAKHSTIHRPAAIDLQNSMTRCSVCSP